MSLKKANVILITPVNAVKGTALFTYLGSAKDGQTLTIGSEVYESDTSGNGVTTGNIAFATGNTGTASTSIIDMLVAIINASGTLVTAYTGASERILTIESKVAGTAYVVTQTLTGTWNASALTGSVQGTVCGKGQLFVDANYLYVAKASNTASGANIWVITGVTA